MSDFIKAGVVGYPVKHSKSPLIHNYWIEKYGLQGSYEAIEIAPDVFESRVRALMEEGYRGFNVTVPHKEAALALCDEVDDFALSVGAVNTVIMRGGRLIGRNTDAFGFIENIKTNAAGFKFSGASVVVLGAGGAARAVLKGLIEEGAGKIYLLNRTRKKAENLAQHFDSHGNIVDVIDWEMRSKILEQADLLVNTTALGMDGQRALDINLEGLKSGALVNDIVYAPLMTPLLLQARDKGHGVVTGIGMLLHQARPAFEAWFGVMPEIDERLEALVLQ